MCKRFDQADRVVNAAQRPRTGFTVPELLLSVGIIGVLLAILLPAILRAQSAARRTQCQNNLKQLNLALSLYHDVYETFPPGYVSRDVLPTDDASAETGSGFAWGSLMLDYVDQGVLSGSIDHKLEPTDPVNFVTASTVLSTWICPTVGGDPAFEVDDGMQIVVLAASSYTGCYGYGSLTSQPGAPPGPGILYRNSHVPLSAVHDGASNTIIIGERRPQYIVSPDQPPIDAHATWYAAIPGAFRPAGVPEFPDLLEGPASLVLSTVGQGEPIPLDSLPNRTTHIAAFSSNHDGGFMAGLADTSVRFISDKLDPDILRHLAQHSDGVPVGEF
ncbi:MAG: DUF1559 domain-containing protein [Planctomycetaceae bacterium]